MKKREINSKNFITKFLVVIALTTLILSFAPVAVFASAEPDLPDGVWTKIKEHISESKYEVSWEKGALPFSPKGAFQAQNRAHQLRTYFTPDGIRILPKGSDSSWVLGMKLLSYGYEGVLNQAPTAEPEISKNRVDYQRSPVTEWYINDKHGLEQGFTLNRPPVPRTEGDLVVEISLSGTLIPFVVDRSSAVHFMDESGRTILRYGGLHVWDANGKTLNASISLVNGNEKPSSSKIAILVDDSDALYPVTIDPTVTSQVAKIIASDVAADDLFGYSVSISNDTVVVGASWDDDNGSNSGSAYIFSRNQGGLDNWGQVKKLIASDGATDDFFGVSVSISNDTVVVGAYADDDNGSLSGSAYIFSRNQGGPDNWGEVLKITASDGAGSDEFGRSVSINDDTLVVGACGDDDNGAGSGSAYIFSRNQGGSDNWGQVKKLLASDGAADDTFGWSVSISNDTLVVGAYKDDDNGDRSGSAYIFSRNQGGSDNWGQVKKLLASDGAAGDDFGYSVSISGDTVVVGAYADDDNGSASGSAYIFSRNQGGLDNWGQVKKLTASDGAAGDDFGWSVSISDDTLVVGAIYDDDNGGSSGSAYIFYRNQGGLDNWGEVAKITASDGAASDYFGQHVSISQDTIVVGAHLDNDNGSNSGSAYIFNHSGDEWLQYQKPIASDGADDDRFGYSVSISNDTAVVGAYDDADNGLGSGSAYIFSRNQGGPDNWGQVTKFTPLDGATNNNFGWDVSISNNTLVVGAKFDDDNGTGSGSAYIFSRNQGGLDNWGQVTKITPSDGAQANNFGYSVSISNDTLTVGAYRDDDNGTRSGSAYIFYRNQGGLDNWGQVTKITASDGAAEDEFGGSVSINNDTVVVGAENSNATFGSAYIFSRNQDGADNWGQVTKITASDGTAGDLFGSSVSISQETIVVGAASDDDNGSFSGSAYIFSRNQGGPDSWGQVVKITASDGAISDYFGYSVSVSNDTVVGGAYNDDDNGSSSGSAYIFSRNQDGADNWGQVTKLIASDGAVGDYFGISVSISNDTVAVGALGDDDNGTDSGSAYIYKMYPKSSSPAPDITVTDAVAPNNDLQILFGNVTEGTSSNQTVTVTNDGDADLIIGTIAQADPLAAPLSTLNDTCSGQTLASATSCTFDVRFAPTTIGVFNDSLDIPSNDPDEDPVTVNVSGTGTAAPTQYTLSVSTNGQGSVTLSPTGGTYDKNTEVTLTAVPGTGYEFNGWSGDLTVSTNPTTITMDANKTVTATFTINTYTITAVAGSNGTISPSGSVSVNHGADQTFTITADANYHVLDVTVDGVSVGTVTSYTFTNVTTDHTIEATFDDSDGNSDGNESGGGGCFIDTTAYGF